VNSQFDPFKETKKRTEENFLIFDPKDTAKSIEQQALMFPPKTINKRIVQNKHAQHFFIPRRQETSRKIAKTRQDERAQF
jgi:hypothetical protein